ncbi:MAG: carbohydrate kinase, partial [Bacteroidota bacterium]
MFGADKSIAAFGEILWDVYPDKKRLGGAPFNFIYHIWKIFGKAKFISSVGNDSCGEEILAKLNSINFDTSLIIV